jgi:hypothetical protein
LGIDNVSSYSLQSLTNDNGYFRAKLANKLVNYASEINGKLEASIFKAMVSGEPVEARLTLRATIHNEAVRKINISIVMNYPKTLNIQTPISDGF